MSMILRVASSLIAKEFPTPEALKKYLKDHPGADPKNHHVTKRDDGSSGSGNMVRVKVKDKEIGKELNNLGMPQGSAVNQVSRLIERDEPVSFNMIDKAMAVLHDQANKPGLDKEKAKKMRSLRDSLKKIRD